MDYFKADKIGKKSLSNLIQDNWLSGQSMGKGIKNAMSDKMSALGKRIGKNFTAMNMIKTLTGSNFLTAAYGKITGKSKSDIAYFTGRKKPVAKRLGNIMGMPQSDGGNIGETTSLLQNMFDFMIKSEDAKQTRLQTEKAFREERDNEEEQRHQQFLKALSAFTGVGAATKVEEKKEGGFLEMIKSMWDSFIKPFKWALDWVLNNKTLLLNIARFFAGPLGIAMLAGTAIVWLADQLKEYFRNNVPDMKVISPTEASNLLTNGTQKDIDNFPGGEKALRDIIDNAPKRATEILARGDKREILAAGGEDKLKQIESDVVTQPPKRDAMKDMAESVTPRKVFAGNGLARKSKEEKWDKQFGLYYDPETGKRLERPKLPENAAATPVPKVATPEPPKAPVEPEQKATPVPTAPPLGKVNDAVAENVDLNLAEQTSSGGSDGKPIIMQNNTSRKLSDSPIPATASTRNEVPILERVRTMSTSPI